MTKFFRYLKRDDRLEFEMTTEEYLKDKISKIVKDNFNLDEITVHVVRAIRIAELKARIAELEYFIGSKYGYACGLDATRKIVELKEELATLENQ